MLDLNTGEKGDLWGAAQYRPWEEAQLQLKLQHWLWQSGLINDDV